MLYVDDIFSRYVLLHGINDIFHALSCDIFHALFCRNGKGSKGERHILGNVADLVTPCAFRVLDTYQGVQPCCVT